MTRLVLLSLVFGCGGASVGTWDASGFHRKGPSYAVAGNGAEIIPGWNVDNWMFARSGLPDSPFERESNWVEYRFDTNGDGRAEFVHRLPVADVLLRHGETGAALWVQLIPIEPRRTERRLRVLLREWVRDSAGARYEVRAVGAAGATVSESRWTTVITASNPAQVQGMNAAAVSFAVSDVDRLRMDRSNRDRVGRAVLIATPLRREPNEYRREPTLRYAMLVALLADPDDYERVVADLPRLIQALRVGDSGGATEGVLPPASPQEEPIVETAPETTPEPVEVEVPDESPVVETDS